MKPHWVVDKYLLDIQNSNATLLERFEEIFQKYNIEYFITQYIPFSEHNEPIPYNKDDKSTIFYSTIGYNRNAMRDGYYYGIFYDEERFSYHNYEPYIKEYVLNKHASEITWGELKRNWKWEFDGYQTSKLFIRPSAGDKLFAGKLVDFYDMEDKIEYWERENDIPLDTPIIVAPPQDIKSEMRFLIVNREVITGSQYRYNGILDVRKDYFQGAYDLANVIAKQEWQLDKAYTCDVAMLEDGSFKVVELNCITCAGMYACDVEKFVLAMNKLVEYNVG
jgi:hypothetical protein